MIPCLNIFLTCFMLQLWTLTALVFEPPRLCLVTGLHLYLHLGCFIVCSIFVLVGIAWVAATCLSCISCCTSVVSLLPGSSTFIFTVCVVHFSCFTGCLSLVYLITKRLWEWYLSVSSQTCVFTPWFFFRKLLWTVLSLTVMCTHVSLTDFLLCLSCGLLVLFGTAPQDIYFSNQ